MSEMTRDTAVFPSKMKKRGTRRVVREAAVSSTRPAALEKWTSGRIVDFSSR